MSLTPTTQPSTKQLPAGEPSTALPPPALTVAAVARRLGVAPATLRTWDRRYGLGPTGHTAGERRRYSASDLARLEHMRRLTHDGVAPADAASAALAADGAAAPASPVVRGLPSPAGRLLVVDDERSGRPGGPGGRILALPRAAGAVRGLSRAAMSLDCTAVEEIVLESLRTSGVIDTWDHLLVPVLRAAGERWASTGEGVEVEHLLAGAVAGALRVVRNGLRPAEPARPVLLCCVAGEDHDLPLHGLSTALAERGVAARLLGPALPDEAIAAAVRRTGAAALFAWSHQAETARAGFLAGLPATRPPTVVLLGGPGWDPDRVPVPATYAHDLGEAVHLVQLAAGVG
ncbi:MAG TPA: MerR family transcriptional regulator [Mycobacteriales bacterium]|nr:MerR family transcriptional regulator [Mycobacteriales bacterium]